MTAFIYIEPTFSRLAGMAGALYHATVKRLGKAQRPEAATGLKAISAFRSGKPGKIFCRLLIKSFNNDVELPP